MMTSVNQNHEPISTVQLSPFGEGQWQRIVTYSPIYVHWTEMLMPQRSRPQKSAQSKLNAIDPIDINNLKLEDEILLNELYDIRKTAGTTLKDKNTDQESKPADPSKTNRETSSFTDFQASSIFSQDSKDQSKHHCSFIDSSVTDKQHKSRQFILSNQTQPLHVNGESQGRKGQSSAATSTRLQPPIIVQLRQTAMARETAFSASTDHRIGSALSISTAKRSIFSASSNRNMHPNQRHSGFKSSLSHDTTTTYARPEGLAGDSINSAKATRSRSTLSSRSTMNMLKTRNDLKRRKQYIQLKTVLVDPYKTVPWNEGVLDQSIPNSLEVMNKLCGPGTPFERNLRYNYQRQLTQLRAKTKKP